MENLFLTSTSFSPCLANSSLTATSFNATLTPTNNTLTYDFYGNNTFSGNDTLSLTLTIASNVILNITTDPCTEAAYTGLCPSNPGEVALNTNINVPSREFDAIPQDVFTKVDPDAFLRLYLNNASSGEAVGCLQANLSNGVARDVAGENETTAADGNGTRSGGGNESDNSGGVDAGSGASMAYSRWTLLL